MTTERVLRIPRADKEGDSILLNIASGGPSPLDLKLTATEGENPYQTTLREARVSKLRSKNTHVDDPAWETILTLLLLGQQQQQQRRDPASGASPKTPDALTNIELLSTISSTSLILLIRQNISGIVHRLGEIQLERNLDLEIDIVAWAKTAVSRCEELDHEVQALQSKSEQQSEAIKALSDELEELIVAKKEHEMAMLEKFRDLLNAKKLKIRDQQRLLAGAKVDEGKASSVQSARSKTHHPTKPPRTASPSRPSKRKAPANSPPIDSPTHDPEINDIDPENPSADEGDAPPFATPEKSDLDATEDEDDDDDGDIKAAVGPSKGLKRSEKGEVIDRVVGDGDEDGDRTRTGANGNRDGKVMAVTSPQPPPPPPPRRDLPFTKTQMQTQEKGKNDDSNDVDAVQTTATTTATTTTTTMAETENAADDNDDNDDQEDDDEETSDDEL